MENEKRLIDAYTLAEEIESLRVTVAGKPARWNDAKYSVLRIIAEQPDVDAEEVVHSRWIRSGNKNECARCGFYYYSSSADYRRCPKCEAKMGR